MQPLGELTGPGMGTGTCWGRSHCRHGPTALRLTTQGSCSEQWGPYRHPTARGQDSGEQHPVGAGMAPGPSPGSSPCPSQLWAMPWSLGRAAGTSGPTASTGPGPAVGSSGRDGGAAGPGVCRRGREGSPALRSELKMCRAGCPGGLRGRKGWAGPGPQHRAPGQGWGAALAPIPSQPGAQELRCWRLRLMAAGTGWCCCWLPARPG